jgi:hypothetical protein
MSIGPLPPLVSVVGTSLAQVKGSDVERTQQDAVGHERRVASGEKAENAAGIAATDEDSQTEDRDADGRRLWEETAKVDAKQDAADTPPESAHKSKDPSGQTGNQLDLSG